jgi:hypothetical protein
MHFGAKAVLNAFVANADLAAPISASFGAGFKSPGSLL